VGKEVQQEVTVRLFSSVVAVFMMAFAFAIPTMANAAGETADADLRITPKTPTFFTNAFSSANYSLKSSILAAGPFPGTPTVVPMKVADISNPPSSRLTFNPKPSMPVCADDKLGPPPTSNSIPVPEMILRCPNSLIGNGTAVFALGQSNNPLANLAGEVLVFNGGRSGGLPKIKVYAYSYDTGVGIYTDAILQPNGRLLFDIPRLTADSSVRQLNLDIPGQKVVINKTVPTPQVVTLPAGQDPNYVQAKCVGDAFPWTADFTMGSRDAGGNPIGPPQFVISDTGSDACTGVAGSARIGSVQVIGRARVKRNRPAIYTVRVRNTGNIAATGVRLRVSGRGVSANVAVGSINPRATRTVRVRLRPRAVGRIRALFRATSRNAGTRAAAKIIRVVR